jgi:hypothetical protein
MSDVNCISAAEHEEWLRVTSRGWSNSALVTVAARKDAVATFRLEAK